MMAALIFTCLWKTAIETLNFLSSVLEQLTVIVLVLLFVKLIQWCQHTRIKLYTGLSNLSYYTQFFNQNFLIKIPVFLQIGRILEVTEYKIFSLAMLIFLYDVIIEDVSVMSSTLKSLMKIRGTSFKFWLRPWNRFWKSSLMFLFDFIKVTKMVLFCNIQLIVIQNPVM